MAKDYSLTGESARMAEEAGLANPKWYRPKVNPALVRELMVKTDRVSDRDAILWILLLVGSATVAVSLWPSWWSLPFWFVYGTLYGSASDARWHECGHKTAFKTEWKNTAIYHLACFFLMRNPYVWRASHVRHHTDSIIVGRDPEIILMRPPQLAKLFANLFGLDTFSAIRTMFRHARGKLTADEADYVRPQDVSRVAHVARVWLCIYAGVIGLALVLGSILPLMLIGLPRIYGMWHSVMTGALQHLGLAENVTDHRLNTRTVLMNPVSRFLYLNMNYHIEHHMFTMVPYHNLPKLHEIIKYDTPAPDPSIWAAYRRLVPVLLKQLRDEQAVIVPDLPEGAMPYRPEVDKLLPHAV